MRTTSICLLVLAGSSALPTLALPAAPIPIYYGNPYSPFGLPAIIRSSPGSQNQSSGMSNGAIAGLTVGTAAAGVLAGVGGTKLYELAQSSEKPPTRGSNVGRNDPVSPAKKDLPTKFQDIEAPPIRREEVPLWHTLLELGHHTDIPSGDDLREFTNFVHGIYGQDILTFKRRLADAHVETKDMSCGEIFLAYSDLPRPGL